MIYDVITNLHLLRDSSNVTQAGLIKAHQKLSRKISIRMYTWSTGTRMAINKPKKIRFIKNDQNALISHGEYRY